MGSSKEVSFNIHVQIQPWKGGSPPDQMMLGGRELREAPHAPYMVLLRSEHVPE